MPVRRFDDDQSQLRVPVVAASDVGDAFSIVALLRPEAKANFESIMGGWTAGGVLAWSFGTNGSNQPFFFVAGDELPTPVAGGALDDGAWVLVAYCQPADDAASGVFRICELGGSPVHIAATTTVNMSSIAGGFFTFGRTDNSDDLDALLATVAIGEAFLSEAEFDAIAAGATTALLLAQDLGGVWDFNQATATDDVPDLAGNHATITGTITGDSDQNGISGTTIVSGSDPDWTFGAGGGDGLQLRSSGAWVDATRVTRLGGAWV